MMSKLLLCLALIGGCDAFLSRGMPPRAAARSVALSAEQQLVYPASAPRIKVGDAVPKINDEYVQDLSGIVGRKLTVLVGVPGAFTPTCSENHVPGFLENRDALAAQGVQSLAVLSVNDKFVMDAWAKSWPEQTEGSLKCETIADGRGAVSAAMGLLVDKGAMGGRCVRCAIVFEDGKALHVAVDEQGLEASSAESVLTFLASHKEAKVKAAAEAKAKAAEEAKAKLETRNAELAQERQQQFIGASVGISAATAAALAYFSQ